MNAPQTPAANSPSPSEYNDPSRLSPTEAATMEGWLREDMASGKISADAAAKAFDELGTPADQRGLSLDRRSAELVQLDHHFPAAKPEEYVIQYDKPGQERSMDPTQKQNLQQFDQMARRWLSQAGFTAAHGGV